MTIEKRRECLCSVTLVVTGSELSPDEVTKIFGITPTQVWKKNETITPRSHAKFKESGWKLVLSAHSEEDLPVTLVNAVSILRQSGASDTDFGDPESNLELHVTMIGLPSNQFVVAPFVFQILSQWHVSLTITVIGE